MMALIAQYTDQLRSQRVIQQLEHCLEVCSIGFGYCAFIQVFTRIGAYFLDVHNKVLIAMLSLEFGSHVFLLLEQLTGGPTHRAA
jgi:hypothetical protein